MRKKERDLVVRSLVVQNSLQVNGNTVAGGLLLGNAELVDLNGEADALVLSADAGTTISAPTNGQIDVELNSVDHVVIKAVAGADSGATTNIVEIAATTPADTTGTNVHNALNIDVEIGNASGGTNTARGIMIDAITDDAQVTTVGIEVGSGWDTGIKTNTISETTGAAGVTIDGVLLKDGGAVFADAATIEVDTVNEATSAAGVTADGVLLKDGGIVCADAATLEVDTINEATANAGVTVDGALLKDGRSNLGRQVQALTVTGAITIKSGLVTLAHNTVVIAATLAAPTAGDELFIVDSSASGTAEHSVTLGAGVTFHGGSNNKLTFNAPGDAIHMIALSATVWFILENIGSVALSQV